ncbi:MAG TPA: DUF4292 domain-containing protein [Chitinophagaceae bacterium]|nr:DUF4292 domain-containing protein [Chitinophagaceae bacterium]
MQKIFILFIISITLLSSCCSTKKIQTAIVKKDTTTTPIVPVDHSREDTLNFLKDKYKSVLVNKINFTTFSAKIDVDYQDGDGKKYNVNANVRMYKDSVIWVSVTAILGIEGLRAYITKDSVKLLDKQNKVYTARSVSYLQEMTELPLSLASLQDLLIGNPVFFDPHLVSYTRSGGTISILSLGEFFKHLLTITETGSQIMTSKLDDLDEFRNRTCYLSYSDYENKKGVNFPSKRTINISEKKKLDIKLHFKQYEFNETLSFPFSVPKNYDRN